MNPGIFKAYDIRGLSPKELDESAVRRITKALCQLYHPKRVLVGRDMRDTSPALHDVCVESFRSSGVDVVTIGLCSTPMFYYAIGSADPVFDLGVMVTASHNPAQYNGLKLMKGDMTPIGQGSGMDELQAIALSEEPIPDASKFGSLNKDETVMQRYLDRIFEIANPSDEPHWRITVDAGNGMNGITMPSFTKRLPQHEWYSLFWEPDGTFPNHEANPLKVETLSLLRDKVTRYGCALGVAFDGDGDRVGFVDEEGTPIPGDLMTALLAQELLRQHPKKTVLYDLRSSNAVPEAIEQAGGNAEMCKVGHSNIKRRMRETKALFAGEVSMHYYFADMFDMEACELAVLLVMNIMTRENQPLSAIWKKLQRYAHSEELNFHVPDSAAVMHAIVPAFESQHPVVRTIDGIRLDFVGADRWWFSLRASNTEPLIRLNLEATTNEQLAARTKELTDLILAQGGKAA